MVDVIAEDEDQSGKRHVLIVESKALGKTLGDKDTNVAYYLDEMGMVAASLNGDS